MPAPPTDPKPPGLYAAGHPASDAPVLVSANYKLAFDLLRRRLDGIDTWILVIETFGVLMVVFVLAGIGPDLFSLTRAAPP